ncbi:replicative DNA helicase [Heyndrickxia oleronia]|uniref:replicative DNA helicase n=1 Tax=Heyndrickxia oleronia TaxID=38875 RepID=UPI001B2A4BE3|nr:DnaB-like helicase C-terminal domain-containing protein [Heyndrickxia oleronia]GIN38483.1 replicative DNA helicase [Heyndrickxia oleronia]
MHSIGEHDFQTDQAEQAVLGGVFLDSNVLDEIVFLEDRDFINEKHQQIYRVMRWLEEKNKPVDIATVAEMYVQHNKLNNVSISYLTQLAESCPSVANVKYYADIVRSKALRRRGETLGYQISALSREDYESDEEYFSAVESLVADLRPQENGKMKSFAETRQDYFKHLITKAEFIPTGFKQFDEWANGLWRGWLFISAGRPSAGKTAMLIQRIIGVAQNGPVLLYSQEMDENQIKDRMISNLTGIPYGRIKKKNLSVKEYAMIEEAYEKVESLPIHIQDSAGITIEEIRATAKRFKRKYGKLSMIAVDYLQIMKITQKKGETRSQAIGNVTREAKQIARKMNCCFMMLSQMTRESENFKKPQLSHLKESGSIEQDADTIEFLWHDPSDTDKNGKVVQQFIAKGRDTGINEFRLLFRGWKQQFEELPRDKTK